MGSVPGGGGGGALVVEPGLLIVGLLTGTDGGARLDRLSGVCADVDELFSRSLDGTGGGDRGSLCL